jgi:hypothetical protein
MVTSLWILIWHPTKPFITLVTKWVLMNGKHKVVSFEKVSMPHDQKIDEFIKVSM